MNGSVEQVRLEKCLVAHMLLNSSILDSSLLVQIDANQFADEPSKKIFIALKSILPCPEDQVHFRLFELDQMNAMYLSSDYVFEKQFLDFETCVQKLINTFRRTALLKNLNVVYADLMSNYQRLSVEDIVAPLTKLVEQAECFKVENGFKKYSEILDDYISVVEQRKINYDNGIIPGIPTGIKELDQAIYGWMPGKYYIVAARTSMGKTTLAINFADAALKAGKRVLLFTNEMGSDEIAEKHLSMRSRVKGPDLFRGSLNTGDIDRLSAGIQQVYGYDFYVSEDKGRDLFDFENLVKKLHRKEKIDLVMLDYVQQMHDSDNRHESRLRELTHISNHMKILARKLKVPIICLAQLNRTADRSDEIPNISQIKDCGAFEQDADCVLLIHRDKKQEPNSNGEVPGTLIIGKARQGKTGQVGIMINFAYNLFK